MESKELVVSADQLALVENSALLPAQLGFILKKTPAKYVRERPAKGGGQWKYVSGGYVKKCLNLMFGFDWDFEIMENQILYGEAIVKGKLTIRTNGKTIIKTQFGNKDIIYRKKVEGELERLPLSIGNDLKAAATDALKKCAAEIGIAADIYNPQEFNEVTVIEISYDWQSLKELFEIKEQELTAQEATDAKRIIAGMEKKSYQKLLNLLMIK